MKAWASAADLALAADDVGVPFFAASFLSFSFFFSCCCNFDRPIPAEVLSEGGWRRWGWEGELESGRERTGGRLAVLCALIHAAGLSEGHSVL